MSKQIITIDDRTYPYQLINKKGVRIYIKFIDGEFKIAGEIEFLKKLDIQKVCDDHPKIFKRLILNSEKNISYKYTNGEEIQILGVNYKIVPSTINEVFGQYVFLNGKEDSKKVFYKVLNPIINEYFTKRTLYFYQQYFATFPFPKITTKVMKTRHGVYRKVKHQIAYSSYLAHHDLDVIDYVIVHELCHMKIMAHNRAFYDEIKKILPNYKDAIKALNERRFN